MFIGDFTVIKFRMGCNLQRLYCFSGFIERLLETVKLVRMRMCSCEYGCAFGCACARVNRHAPARACMRACARTFVHACRYACVQ